ncbi:abortive infection Abi-like protein [Asanoa ferruginea]|uniref:Abortive infection Abi-like protein n=1 Tax=Asanoa ferruginea TaxID=53367 RepID=A0A3D9ZKD7_9ACTN|nr:abortive infection Abi-like protein [Asanoa ferruginea]GIF52992.1 hypothetical protein Afe04nite_75310 [Asanoa ferruginea]
MFVTDADLIPLPVRRYFRDLSSSHSTLGKIDGMWRDHGFALSDVPNDESGERRSRWRRYEDGVDWMDPADARRVLKVYEHLLDEGQLTKDELKAARAALRRHDFVVYPNGMIDSRRTWAPKPRKSVPQPPASLSALRDPSMILDSFDRIARALPDDPAQAIGSAKELIEATAKTVLGERGVPFDDRTVKLPWLVDTTQRELHLHPQTLAPGPDGSQAVKRILGGLSGIAMGLVELRNEGYGTGHAPAAPRVGLHRRHAVLAVGAAHVWCQLVLDTFADPGAPWRTAAPAAAPAAAGP